ncbi:SAGA-associated factor 29 homolog B-like isoform X2 [Alnus glutinosa]|uniref:SAGA-associated factor 29 homolog B-like isoform X2 n=1 Tax=Alnus glutinosa TaxID=3517 RepID=UPI002D76BA54|nr:SAGA-associated factor 29 homolog B-like isoform X2 [Alnus glutinosa]
MASSAAAAAAATPPTADPGNDKKRKRVKTDSNISRKPANVQSELEACASLKFKQVAAKVTPAEADKDDWFVVKVLHFDKETREFEVIDEEPGDDDEGGGQRKYKLPMSSIIPFPKRGDASTAPDFPPRSQVLAVYPGTTALYKATVVNGHRKRKTENYLLEFDDDEEDGSLPQRTVPFHKVVALPDGHRQ